MLHCFILQPLRGVVSLAAGLRVTSLATAEDVLLERQIGWQGYYGIPGRLGMFPSHLIYSMILTLKYFWYRCIGSTKMTLIMKVSKRFPFQETNTPSSDSTRMWRWLSMFCWFSNWWSENYKKNLLIDPYPQNVRQRSGLKNQLTGQLRSRKTKSDKRRFSGEHDISSLHKVYKTQWRKHGIFVWINIE